MKAFQADLGAAKGLASELAKILLPSGDGEQGQTMSMPITAMVMLMRGRGVLLVLANLCQL